MVDETASGPTSLATPEITPTEDPLGLAIRDPIENAVFQLLTDRPAAPTPAQTDHFCFPIDTAVTLQSTRLVVPICTSLLVRDTDGTLLRDCATETTFTLGDGPYLVEVSSAPVKLYLAVTGEMTVERTSQQSAIHTTGHIDVGVRSFHEHPAGTITVTDDPHDTLDALSYLGSALKTHSPERSFPTLRGHPPLIERGDEFSVPSHLDTPDTGITLVVPPTYDYAYPVAPLAYYLGADVVPGDDPRLVADGREFPLPDDSFQTAVDQTLEQLVFLDCLTRTEGYYQVELHERAQVDDVLSIPYKTLYDAPLDARTAEYLAVPYDDLEPAIPTWDLTADLEPDPENVGVLPFFANRLAKVRVPDPDPPITEGPLVDAVADLWRGGPDESATTNEHESETASEHEDANADEHDAEDDDGGTESVWPSHDSTEVFTPIDTDSLEHVYVGEGYPIGTSKGIVDAYRRRLDERVPEQSSIQVHVVCNDDQMTEEGDVERVYGTRDYLDFDVTFHEQLTTDELAAVLREPADFLHYIGHIEPEGFLCTDGCLDAAALETVNVKSFLLNACRSYQQGRALIENGSLGGIVTIDGVANVSAIDIGRALARLLDHGFPLRSACNLAKREVIGSYQYTVLGVGSLQLVQYESGTPQVVKIEAASDDRVRASFRSFSVPRYGMGTLFTHDLDASAEERFLHPDWTRTFTFDRDTFDSFLATEQVPVLVDGDLRWGDDLANQNELSG